MGKRYVSPTAICPYYRSQKGSVIYCEGVEENSSIHVAFGDPKNKDEYQRRCCMSYDYEQCTVAAAHERRWREKEETDGKQTKTGDNGIPEG